MVFLISYVSLISLNSFALTAKDTRNLMAKEAFDTNIYRIESAARSGECKTEAFLTKDISVNITMFKKLEKLGYKILDIPNKMIILWCE